MKRLDLQLSSPAENLAADEVLLDLCENGAGGETLVFWEPRAVFVVVGYANKVAAEVNTAACEKRGIPVFRRCSGGGTVVQMPGGLNYSLILPITETGPTRNITAANQFIMEKNRAAIAGLLPAAEISVRGHTDLCLGNLKFAGNSQRRRKHFLLFHGTLLLDCDLSLISELLQMPSLQPDYRASRPHESFVTNLNLSAQTVKTALAKAWNAVDPAPALSPADISRLVAEKYSTKSWNLKF
ncbi:MAG: lipoate--protein ligase family protein [Verrucomicrobiae bacterium]|nr:lipoate--protein ligase family protein [Verrucomicrobiae bacterium]